MCAVCVQEADQAQSVEKGAEEQIVSVGEQAQNGSVEEEGVKDGRGKMFVIYTRVKALRSSLEDLEEDMEEQMP